MSYLRKGFRQSQFKNVIERGFLPRSHFHRLDVESMDDTERVLETSKDYKRIVEHQKSNYLHFGTRIRNTSTINTDGTRNYNNCLDQKGNFIKFTGQEHSPMRHYDLVDLKEVQNLEIFKEYGSKDKLFHLTSPKNWDKIRNYGLISLHKNHNYMGRENRLYFVSSDHEEVLNSVGFGQITTGFESPIVVLEIDMKGITGDLYGEEGGEYTSIFHTVLVNQKRILPQYIKYHKTFISNEKRYYDFRRTLGEGKSEFYKNTMGVERDQLKLMGIDRGSDMTLHELSHTPSGIRSPRRGVMRRIESPLGSSVRLNRKQPQLQKVS